MFESKGRLDPTLPETVPESKDPTKPTEIIVAFVGNVDSSKCLRKDTPVLMYDGSINPIQDIKEGDNIMGDDST